VKELGNLGNIYAY